MTRLAIIAAALAISTGLVQAGEQSTFYGPDGRRTGTATTSGNTTTFYDAQGRRAGSATRSGDTTTYYDARGRRTGTQRENRR